MKRSADDANGSSSGPTKRSRESADCPHPASWHGMCISCGKSVEGAKGVQQTIGGGVTLEYNSRETVARAGQLRETLETEQKLALALDLDHTLLHTTMNPGAPEYLKKVYNGQIVKMDESNARAVLLGKEADSEENCVFQVSLRVSGERQPPTVHYIKLRPGVRAFLRSAVNLFRMYIYTHGNREYANAVARILDPDRCYFQNRIVSRTDTPDLRTSKSLERLFPEGLDMALVVDDNEKVYIQNGEQMGNLISCQQYHFWPPNMGEINIVPGTIGDRLAGEEPSEGKAFPGDSQLRYIWDVLQRVHRLCYPKVGGKAPDSSRSRRSVAISAPDALAKHRGAILKGARVVLAAEGFSRSQLERWIRCLGASPVFLDAEIEDQLAQTAPPRAQAQNGDHVGPDTEGGALHVPSDEDRSLCCQVLLEKYDVSHVLGVNRNWKVDAALRYGRCWVLHIDWLYYGFFRTVQAPEARFLLTGARPATDPSWDPDRPAPMLPEYRKVTEAAEGVVENGDGSSEDSEPEEGEIPEDLYIGVKKERAKELAEFLLDSDSDEDDDP